MATVNVTDASFQSDVLDADKPVLVDFWADWCGPCKMIAPELEKLAVANPTVKVVKIDVDAEEDLAAALGVEAMPTFIQFVDGQKGKVVQGANKAALAALF